MGATQKFQLLVESQARGEAEIARLSATVNKLGEELARANRKIAEDAVKSQVRYSDAMKRMKDDTEASISGAQKSTSEGSAGFGRYAASALAAYAAIKTVAAGFDTFVRGAGEAALEVKSLSLSTGLTVSQADKLRAAATLTGFDIRNLKEAALDLSVALKDTGGQGDQTRQLLKQLGVSAYTATGQTRSLNDVLLETFDALSKVTDTTQRVNLSRVLGGEDAAKNVQPLLTGYREANQLAEQLGFGTRDGLLKALDESNKQLRAFDLQWEIIKGKLAEKVAPIIVPVLLTISKIAAGKIEEVGKLVPGVQSAEDLGRAIRQSVASSASGVESAGISSSERITEVVNGRPRIQVPTGLVDFSTSTQLGERFRKGLAGGEDGIKSRLDSIAKERAALSVKLSSGSLSESEFQKSLKGLARLEAEQRALNLRLAGLNNAEAIRNSLTDLEVSKAANDDPLVRSLVERSKFVAGIAAQGGSTGQQLRAYNAFDSQMSNALASRPGSAALNLARLGIGTNTRYGDGSVIIGGSDFGGFEQDPGIAAKAAELDAAKAQRERELNTAFARQFVSFQERKIELLTGPGGELDAINRIYELKKAGLEQELEFGTEIFNLTERRTALEQERTLRLLDLQRQRRDEARGLASDFVGSVQAGDPGSFFRQQGSRLVNQVGTNLLTGTFQRAQGVLGKIGEASGLGSLLKGTLLDPANATPVDRNTLATERNTAAIERATGARGGGIFDVAAAMANGGVGGFTLPGVPGILNAAGLISDANGLTGQGPLVVPKSTGAVQSAPGFIGLGTDATGAVVPLSTGGGISNGAKGVGIAGLAIGGAVGAYTQFKAGGAQGALNGTAALAGAASGILALSGVSGPAAPIIAGVGLGLQAIAAILGDPKKKRDAEINRQVSAAYYEEAAPMAYNFDRFGRGADYNKFGDLRSVPVQININALDSKSIADNWEPIADAVRIAVWSGHGMNRALQQELLPA